ncbi:MAG: hemerythrin domain-containing protein [Oligoflexia bacterium]|nr:hemerythrin domain-containing protein [Oligoflexia bacterium]
MNLLRSLVSQHDQMCGLARRAAQTPFSAERNWLLQKLARQLELHLRLEEAWLYPELEPHEELMRQVKVLRLESGELRRLLGRIMKEAGEAELRRLLQEFLSLLEDHCRMEEWDLLRDAERIMPGVAIRELRQKIERAIGESGWAA